MRFALTKWYIDVVTDDGRVAIVYRANVQAAGLAHGVSGVLRSDGGRAASAFTLHTSPAPVFDGETLHWRCEPLDIWLDAERLARPCCQRLLETADGTLDWHGEAPRARVRLRVGDDVLEGLGYAERLELSLAPWTLPIDVLRWGRWASATRSAIWIAWDGPQQLRLAFLDGVRTGDVTIHPGAVDIGGARLTLSDNAMITNATLGEQLGVLAPLRSLVERVAGSRQTRWRARGSLRGPDGRDEVGWVVHEEVAWR